MNHIAGLARHRLNGVAAAALAATRSIAQHWLLAGFSLVAAFAIWALIEDVDNPRITGDAPAEGGIRVEGVNIPNDLIIDDLGSVRVVVEALRRDLPGLRPSDFTAEVDLKDIASNGGTRAVKVTSKARGVTILKVTPREVEVRTSLAATRDVPVTARITTGAPAGFTSERLLKVDPPSVTIKGSADLVARVDAVEVDVSLANARQQGEFSVEGELVARSAGNRVDVSLSHSKAKATFEVKQVFLQRTLGLNPVITGSPAPGYVITSVSSDPAVIQVTGEKSIIEGLQGPINLEKLDVTGAQQSITITKLIDRPPNVVTDRQSVVVRVEITPLACGAGVSAACPPATFFLAPSVEGPIPTGLRLEGSYTVIVRISGPLALLAALKPDDLRATISVAGLAAGQSAVTPRVIAPPGIHVDGVEPLNVVLVTATGLGP